MLRRLTLAGGVVLTAAALAGPAAAQSRIIEFRGPPVAVPPIPGWQAEEIRSRMKEEVELMEAALESKKVHAKAAAVRLDVAKQRAAAAEKANAPAKELVDAKTAVDLAQADLDVKQVELKEAELRVKVAKRRVESGVYPLVLTPVPAPSIFPPPSFDPKNGDKIPPADPKAPNKNNEQGRLELQVQDRQAAVAKAEATVAQARAEHDRVQKLVVAGAVVPAEKDATATRLAAAEADLLKAQDDLTAAQREQRAATVPPVAIVLPEQWWAVARYPAVQPGPVLEGYQIVGVADPRQAPARLGNPIARVNFPTAESDFALAQIEVEVANLRVDAAKVEVSQLEKLGAKQEDLDAARLRLDEAKRDLRAAEDEVLRMQLQLEKQRP